MGPFAYVRWKVEEERLSLLGWRGNKITCKVSVRVLQIQEVHRLLLDDLIVHQRDSHGAHITQTEALYIRWEAGQILTGSLKKDKEIIYYSLNWRVRPDQRFIAHHVVGVRDAEELVKPLPGGKKCPVCSKPEVPLPHGSSGVAQRFQYFGDGGLIQRETAPGAWE